MRYKKILSILLALSIYSLSLTISQALSSSNFLVLSDIHLDHDKEDAMEISPYDETDDNDLDKSTFYYLLNEINTAIQAGKVTKPDFILVLGDIVDHSRSTPDSAVDDATIVFKSLKDYFPNTPILYTYGNNDSMKIKYGPFLDPDRNDAYKTPFDVATINGGWVNGFLSTGILCQEQPNTFPCLLSEDKTNGYYSAYVQPGLRYISLNSVLFSPKRVSVSQQDSQNEWQWLSKQLQVAEKYNEAVLISMHVPPGNNISKDSNYWLPEEQTQFLQVIKTYQHSVIGILASHTHMEELKVIRDQSDKIIAGVYFTAALSTSRGNEPSFKLFNLAKDSDTWQLTDYTTFHFTTDQIKLKELYNFQNLYCTSDNQRVLQHCLSNVTSQKMGQFYSAGNPNYNRTIIYPEHMNILQD